MFALLVAAVSAPLAGVGSAASSGPTDVHAVVAGTVAGRLTVTDPTATRTATATATRTPVRESGGGVGLLLPVLLVPDGDRWIQVHVQPARDEGIIGVMTDVTEGKRREQQLVLLHRLLRHDIRNDMAVITGWLDVLAEQTRGTQRIIDRVRTASEQVLNLTEDTRDIVSATTEAFATEREPTSLGPMLSIIVEEKRELYPGATVELDLPQEPPTAAANALLSTVFRNLVQNAILHNDAPEPTVRVEVETQDDRAVISLSDNCPGVPEETEGRLFRMGEKGDRQQGNRAGTLPLSPIRRVVRRRDLARPGRGRGGDVPRRGAAARV